METARATTSASSTPARQNEPGPGNEHLQQEFPNEPIFPRNPHNPNHIHAKPRSRFQPSACEIMQPMSPAAGSTLTAWTRALHQVAALQDQLRFALRIAGYTNQRAVARRLLTALERLRDTTFDVTVLGKPECGATLLAAKIQAAFPYGPLPAVRPTIVETPDY